MDKKVALILCLCLVVSVQAGLYRDALIRDILDEVDRQYDQFDEAVKDEGCRDESEDCAEYIQHVTSNGHQNPCIAHRAYMKEFCQATCNIDCESPGIIATRPPRPGLCEDDDSSCISRVNNDPRRCENHYYKKYCRKSCGECH